VRQRDRCLDSGQVGDTTVAEPALTINTPVQHRDWGDGVVIGEDTDRVTVLFDQYGYRTLSMRAVEENNLLVVR
jgi:ATP-dependent DNA helicase RecQ